MSWTQTWDENAPRRGDKLKFGATKIRHAADDIEERMRILIGYGSIDAWYGEGYGIGTTLMAAAAASVPAGSTSYTLVHSMGFWNGKVEFDANIDFTAVLSAPSSGVARYRVYLDVDGQGASGNDWARGDLDEVAGFLSRGYLVHRSIQSNIQPGTHTLKAYMRAYEQDLAVTQMILTISPILLDT